MFFTQDDYKKIQQWLTKNSVKDTEFNEANIPFKGNEIITIVQENQNKKVFLKDLVAQIFNLGVSDFINVSEKYDAYIIDLEEAIRLIPSGARKRGQVITFLNKENLWQIYQFKGALNQWNVLDQWEDIFSNTNIDSILPDEEDLTKSLPDKKGNSYLSLKNREYKPEDFSGLGRIILRKNIVEVEGPVEGKVRKNVLYQYMFTQSNTVYEIRYDFDLNGQEITIPEGSVLDFQGGSLSNGTVIGNNTIVNAKLYKILDKIEGSWNVDNSYIEWFGVNSEDCSESFTKAIKMSKVVRLVDNAYPINITISNDGQQIIGNGDSSIIIPVAENTTCISIQKDNQSEIQSICIKNINFQNLKDLANCIAIRCIFNSRSLIKSCRFSGAWNNAIYCTKCVYFTIRDINAENNINCITADGGGTFFRIEDSVIINCVKGYYIKLIDCPSTWIINTHLGANDAFNFDCGGIYYSINNMFSETYLLIDKCDIDSMKGDGIKIENTKSQRNIHNCIISNNWISCGRNNTGNGINAINSHVLNIQGNKFYWTGNNNILLSSCGAININNNTFEYAEISNIKLLNSKNCIISNNILGSLSGDPIINATPNVAIIEEEQSDYNLILHNYFLDSRNTAILVGKNSVVDSYTHQGSSFYNNKVNKYNEFLTRATLNSGDDYNNFITPGVCSIFAENAVINGPSPHISYGILKVYTGSNPDFILQEATQINGSMFKRTRNEYNEWSSWSVV